MTFQEQVSSRPAMLYMAVLDTVACMTIDIRIMKDS